MFLATTNRVFFPVAMISARERLRRSNFKRWLDDYYCAYQAWWEIAEYETMFYKTELIAFKEISPCPKLRDWMFIQKGYYA